MTIQFRLSKISLPQFAILNDVEAESLNVEYEVHFSVNKIQNKILCTFKIVYKNDSDVVMQMIAECYYQIAPSSWSMLIKPDGNIVIPAEFLQHLGSLTVGTARGILYARCYDTNLEKHLLPLINLTELITGDMIVEG